MKTQLSPKIDFSGMTEEEFLTYLDSEAKRIREEHYIMPVTKLDQLAKIKTYKIAKLLKR
jgi:hypothetical protein